MKTMLEAAKAAKFSVTALTTAQKNAALEAMAQAVVVFPAPPFCTAIDIIIFTPPFNTHCRTSKGRNLPEVRHEIPD